MLEEIDELAAEHGFSGVVLVSRGDETLFGKAYGLAHRGYGVANTVDTRFAIASGTKGLTALTVVSLISDDVLKLETPAREWLGEDLPLIGDDVTVEHLLSHRSGIGDYCDEDDRADISEYHPPVAPDELTTVEQYVPTLAGHPAKFPAGQRFEYNNGAFVVLALLAERASGVPFPDLVRTRVCEPAGMTETAFLRSDELPGRTAVGYISDVRTNLFSLPAVGTGDGGIYSTVRDFRAFWPALFAGRIVPAEWVSRMTAVLSTETDTTENLRYGLGFWLPLDGTVMLEGYDAGVSFRSVHDPASGVTHTVVSNTSEGAWPLTRWLSKYFLTGS